MELLGPWPAGGESEGVLAGAVDEDGGEGDELGASGPVGGRGWLAVLAGFGDTAQVGRSRRLVRVGSAEGHDRTKTPDGRTLRLPPPAVSTRHLEDIGRELPFAPAYGQDTDAVLTEVGLDLDQIGRLRESGVVT